MLGSNHLIGYGIVDNAEGNLDAGINGSATQCQLGSGEGALFPTTINGAATSGGTSTTLNSTGIQADGVVAGDIIKNLTDGSEAVVRTVSTNSITTTPLQGGSDDTWENNDEWAVGSFVITAVQYNTTNTPSSGIAKREKILVDYRATDILHFNTNGRGYDGTSGQSFDANDNIYYFVKKLEYEGLLKGIIDNLDRIVEIEDEYINSDGSNPFDNNVAFTARNNADSADIDLFKLLTTDILEFQTLPRNPSTRTISDDYDIVDKKYVDAQAALIGEIKMWAGSSAPANHLLCYGQAVSRTTYANLFAEISTTYGVGDGSTTFNLPDLRGRMPLGKDNMGGASADRVTNAQADTLGGSEGAEDHTLIEAEMPAHTHSVSLENSDTLMGGSGAATRSGGPITTGSTGGDGSHNNMPPYLTINYIIRY